MKPLPSQPILAVASVAAMAVFVGVIALEAQEPTPAPAGADKQAPAPGLGGQAKGQGKGKGKAAGDTLVEGPWYLPSEKGTVHVSVVTKGLDHPWGLAILPDGDMLVTERPGRLR